MADTANTVYLKDKDKNVILPATDWSVVNNKPNNLVTADEFAYQGYTTNGIQWGDNIDYVSGGLSYYQLPGAKLVILNIVLQSHDGNNWEAHHSLMTIPRDFWPSQSVPASGTQDQTVTLYADGSLSGAASNMHWVRVNAVYLK